MKFFKLNGSIKKKEIGRYPQFNGGIINAHSKSFSEQGDFGPVKGSYALFSFILYKTAKPTDFIGDKLSKWIISSNIFYSFLKPLLNNIQHQVWDTKVYNSEAKTNFQQDKLIVKNKDKLKVFDYKLFHLSYPQKDFIDYSKTSFKVFKRLNETIEYDKVNFLNTKQIEIYDKISNRIKTTLKINIEEIVEDNLIFNSRELCRKKRMVLQGRQEMSFLKPKKVVFNTNHIKDDIFRIYDHNISSISGYYVSEKLKNEIEKQGFTGMEFLSLDELSNDYEVEIL